MPLADFFRFIFSSYSLVVTKYIISPSLKTSEKEKYNHQHEFSYFRIS